ncbi:unnamed protein product, partial [Meganyctiphanes norvegica]
MDEYVKEKVKNEFEIYEETLHTQDIDNIIKEEEIEKNEEPMQIQDVDMEVGEENVKFEEPVAGITECYPVKHQIIHVGNKLHQCSHSDNSSLTSLLRKLPREKQYQCSKCEKELSHSNDLKIHK